MKFALVAVTLVTAAGAVPMAWTESLGAYVAAISNTINNAKASSNALTPTCDLSNAQQPAAPTALPAPTGLTLSQVAIGRGIQNYTCANSDAATIPVQLGAVANLYDVSCIAANYGDILNMIPNLALQYATPDGSAPLQPSNVAQSGHHFFNAAGVPTFSMNDNGDSLGIVTGKVNTKTPAPTTAAKGQNGQGNGAVPWLYLTATNATVGNVKAIYRLNTAGGQPPANCAGQPSLISVEYSAEYWFYS